MSFVGTGHPIPFWSAREIPIEIISPVAIIEMLLSAPVNASALSIWHFGAQSLQPHGLQPII
ncbi:hypothetical protein [Pseudoneobacillus rhizosphaerae]|uniref:hypothetical protein n=1 Tax=Pseudoneobacillus rhizosphaerae TaxID=2880968 RepID=UPI001E36EC1A|nr:hypothetical protein [Pseudoneobacillus rhizosphaerae]